MKHLNKINIFLIIGLLSLAIISQFFFFRIDLTSEKKYSISVQTKKLLKNTESELNMTVYLSGDLNPGFLHLKKATRDMLEEMSVYTNKGISIVFKNPSEAPSNEAREQKYAELEAQGMNPTAIYERDKEGKSIQKIVFPWLKIEYKNKAVYVNLLKNIRGNSGDENLNISIENLEFAITDGIRQILNTKISKIAFLEGQGELTEAETYDITKSLSHYFQIDRGVLSNDATVLNNYQAVIIAKPTKPFSESDKYIIDQYIMNGGRVLWLIDGVKLAAENLSKTGTSPVIDLDLNLSDQLFKYGFRINPDLLQDVQCVSVPVNIAPANAQPQFEPTPWYYAPLLLTSYEHPITKNVSEVMGQFTSSIESVGKNPEVKSTLLLATSDNTHIIPVPATIDLADMPDPKDKNYFNQSYIPVAILAEGIFESCFQNRLKPQEITTAFPFMKKSINTRQIVIADGDIIRNETTGIASDSTTIPLGLDRYTNQQFGNKEFIQNAVLYLTDEEGWLQLRSRTFKLRLLNKSLISNEKTLWQVVILGSPLLLLFITSLFVNYNRRKKYTKIN
ncbi:MAG: gliding motility-associated ABC transporter substrate-binding protein GldG [Paludibacter sp.]|nr:gliding motility-associated ABC transporter substrate-binding protein GldG [Paludibacter sp.]